MAKLKKVILTLESNIYSKLKAKATRLGFGSAQDYIYDMIRRNVYNSKSNAKSSGKINVARILTKKKIFSTKAKGFPI